MENLSEFKSTENIESIECVMSKVQGSHNFSSSVEERIQNFWDSLIAEQPDLYDGPLLRVGEVKREGNIISVQTLPDITYRQLVGMRNMHREDKEVLPESV